jgi:hypothetical protein
MNPNFRTHCTSLAMARLAREQEPNKKILVHAPYIHGGGFMGIGSF